MADGRLGVHRRSQSSMAAPGPEAAPLAVPGGVGLTHSPPLCVEEFLPIDRPAAGAQGRDGACQLLGQPGQRCALSVLLLHSRPGRRAGRMVPQQQHGGFGDRPLQRGVAARDARKAVSLPRGCLGTLDQTARGDKILDPGKALEVMQRRQEHQAQAFAAPGDGLEPGAGVCVVLLSGCDDRSRHSAAQRSVVAHQREGSCQTLWDRRRRKPRGDARAGGCVGALLPALREVGLTIRVLDRRQ